MSLKAIAFATIALLATAAIYHYQYRKSANAETLYLTTPTGEDSNYVTNLAIMFKFYKEDNGLKFGSSENTKRFEIFSKNVKIIEKHNALNSSYKLGVTSLTHLTQEEFAALKLGFDAQGGSAEPIETNDIFGVSNLISEVDWVAEGAVTRIKNQGLCECCWAFSTTGALEGLNYIKSGKLISLSEQELVDCATSYINRGCNGGHMIDAFRYVSVNGISSEETYPFVGVDGRCRKVQKELKIRSYSGVLPAHPDHLAAAIRRQPVSVAVNANSEAFQLYKSGILTGDACGTDINHAVLAVGYGTMNGQPYFKVKNSWGTGWGDKGYVYIERTSGPGVCGVNMAGFYPIM